jgi:hypothetical protein
MLRTRKAKVLSGAGLALAALAALLTGPAAHAAITGDNFIWAGLNGNSGCELHAHAHNSPLQLDPCGNAASPDSQTWQLVDPQKVGTQTAVELQLVGTDECANDSFYTVYLDSCVAGDANELFWPRPASAASNWWFVNVAASERSGQSEFMTAACLTLDCYVYDEPSGNGQLADWYVFGS